MTNPETRAFEAWWLGPSRDADVLVGAFDALDEALAFVADNPRSDELEVRRHGEPIRSSAPPARRGTSQKMRHVRIDEEKE